MDLRRLAVAAAPCPNCGAYLNVSAELCWNCEWAPKTGRELWDEYELEEAIRRGD